MCALLVPDDDHMFAKSLQDQLEHMPQHDLALFAAVQATEWGLDLKDENAAANAVAWKRIYATVSGRGRGRKWKRNNG